MDYKGTDPVKDVLDIEINSRKKQWMNDKKG